MTGTMTITRPKQADRGCARCGKVKPLTLGFWCWRTDLAVWRSPCRSCINARARERDQRLRVVYPAWLAGREPNFPDAPRRVHSMKDDA